MYETITNTERLINYSYLLCAGGSLILFKPAFWTKRPEYYPNFPYSFPSTFTQGMPTIFMRLMWLFGLSNMIGMGLTCYFDLIYYFRLFCFAQTLWAVCAMLVDESFWGPQMIHFMVTTFTLSIISIGNTNNMQLLRY
jgi:hypothetical protein